MRHCLASWERCASRRPGLSSVVVGAVLGMGGLGGVGISSTLAQGEPACNPTNVGLRTATATWSQECGIVFYPGMIIDGNTTTAWALAHCDGLADRSHSESICVETFNDLTAGTTPVRITLKAFSGAFFAGEGGGNLSLGKFSFSYTGDPRDQFADGRSTNGQMGEHWTVLTPDTVQAQWSDAAGNPLPPMGYDPILTIQPDGSILASGPSPEYALYTVTFTVRDVTITGFKIDFIDVNGESRDPAEGLPTGGPGRHGNGNLLLHEIAVGYVLVPTITQEPQDGRLCHGDPYTLSVGVDGYGPFSYQWRRNGGAIGGATGSTYRVSGSAATASYDCIVSAPCGDLTSRVATVTASCAADYNCDGFVDFFDYDDYVVGYLAGETNADCNGDDFIDFFDYDCFTGQFQAGC